ncbi:hypothetical protein F5141DRAFT_1069866 [Pisolithus sp. B1]|nr:hypothetical protein F5141DRAFT_1069866 [Pisolithus sp. B1]
MLYYRDYESYESQLRHESPVQRSSSSFEGQLVVEQLQSAPRPLDGMLRGKEDDVPRFSGHPDNLLWYLENVRNLCMQASCFEDHEWARWSIFYLGIDKFEQWRSLLYAERDWADFVTDMCPAVQYSKHDLYDLIDKQKKVKIDLYEALLDYWLHFTKVAAHLRVMSQLSSIEKDDLFLEGFDREFQRFFEALKGFRRKLKRSGSRSRQCQALDETRTVERPVEPAVHALEVPKPPLEPKDDLHKAPEQAGSHKVEEVEQKIEAKMQSKVVAWRKPPEEKTQRKSLKSVIWRMKDIIPGLWTAHSNGRPHGLAVLLIYLQQGWTWSLGVEMCATNPSVLSQPAKRSGTTTLRVNNTHSLAPHTCSDAAMKFYASLSYKSESCLLEGYEVYGGKVKAPHSATSSTQKPTKKVATLRVRTPQILCMKKQTPPCFKGEARRLQEGPHSCDGLYGVPHQVFEAMRLGIEPNLKYVKVFKGSNQLKTPSKLSFRFQGAVVPLTSSTELKGSSLLQQSALGLF